MFRFFIFLCMIFSACRNKEQITEKQQIVRLAIPADPVLDPRKARDLNSGIVLRLLNEGLMRTAKDGKIEKGIAKEVEISSNGLVYTFYLKKMNWSDGSPLTAEDFLTSWMTILDPRFPTDTAYNLYPIKNAKRAKCGEVSVDRIGVEVVDSETLRATLEQPTPYFLELLTMPSFFPVPKEGNEGVSNGPFTIESWAHGDQIRAKKNIHYWDAENVFLDGIEMSVLAQDTEVRLMEEQKLDWIGSPLSTLPKDALDFLKKENKLNSAPYLGTQICRLNTSIEGPLSDRNFRKALALSVNRKAIVDHILGGGQTVATGFVPPVIGGSQEGYFKDSSIEEEEIVFEKPSSPLVLSYYNTERSRLIAQTLQKEWEKRLKIEVALEAVEPKVFFQKISNKEYEIALGSWIGDFGDPINFLEVFKTKESGSNNTGWENPKYIELLNASSLCTKNEERKEILAKAEKILMEEMPIIPLFFNAQNYVKNNALVDAYVSPQGHLILRDAKFKEE